MKITICWRTKDAECVNRIRERFKISSYRSINWETTVEIKETDMEALRKEEKNGFINIRNKE